MGGWRGVLFHVAQCNAVVLGRAEMRAPWHEADDAEGSPHKVSFARGIIDISSWHQATKDFGFKAKLLYSLVMKYSIP